MGLPPLSLNAWMRYDVVTRLLQDLDARSVLELGAGEGALGARLALRHDYLGLEPDARSFERARARIEHGQVLQGDLSALEPGAVFDLVCAFELLEHLEDDAAALREWHGCVRPGGWLLLSVPALGRRWGAADVKAGHRRRYEREELATLLRSAGFDPARIENYGFPLGNALEHGRNLVARFADRRGSAEERTAASGRWLQPPDWAAPATELASAPFRLLQRPFAGRDLGPGFVVLARRS